MSEAHHTQRLPDGCAFDDAGAVVRVVEPPAELGDVCPHCQRPYDEEDAEPTGQMDTVMLEKAFERGIEAGKAQGQRELLQRLFHGVTTAKQLVERAAALAFVQEWPADSPCPLTASDLADVSGMSERSAARFKANARTHFGSEFSR